MYRLAMVLATTALLIAPGRFVSLAQAQEAMPNRIMFVVGYAPGGSTDIIARVIANKLAPRLNAAIAVKNDPGASGMVAAESVSRSAKDGSTLLLASSNEVTILPALKKHMEYDARTAFAPVSLIGMVPLVLAVHPSLPVASVSDLVELAKKEPGRLSYASFGVGTVNHLTAELFKSVTGTNLIHVPYKGGGAAMPDLLSGRVEVCFHAIQVALPYIRSGALRPLAYTGAKRSPLLPNVPTMEEAGLPGFVVGSWVGVLAPAGTPAGIVDKLDAELRAVLAEKDVQDMLQAQGTVLAYKSSREFRTFTDSEMKRWAALAASAHISIE